MVFQKKIYNTILNVVNKQRHLNSQTPIHQRLKHPLKTWAQIFTIYIKIQFSLFAQFVREFCKYLCEKFKCGLKFFHSVD